MSKPKVLLDTNIFISGIVFLGGNEHKILKMVERQEIVLVLPEFVIQESLRVLRERFTGYEALLEIFLFDIDYLRIEWDKLEPLLPLCKDRIRDKKDAAFLAAIILEKPDYAVSGDKNLREDLGACVEATGTKICTSGQFLKEFLTK